MGDMAKGLLASSYPAASALTVVGYPAALQLSRYNVGLMEGNAENVMRTMLADGDLDLDWLNTTDLPTSPQPGALFPSTPAPPSVKPTAYNSGGGSGGWDWGGIIKNFFGAVGGVAGAFGGKPPPPAPAPFPVVPVVVGGALLLGAVYFLSRK